jgi:methylmalonyl-CoA mutase cobalamin-binding subunit
MHEVGALMAAVTAAAEGWRVTYLGIDLPVAEIAKAAIQKEAAAVGLSVAYGNGGLDHVLAQLRELRTLLPDGTALLIGGRASEEIEEALHAAGAIYIPDLTSLRSELMAVKTRAAGF